MQKVDPALATTGIYLVSKVETRSKKRLPHDPARFKSRDAINRVSTFETMMTVVHEYEDCASLLLKP